MEREFSVNSRYEIMTLTDILPFVRQLRMLDKLRLIRIIAEQLDTDENIFPLESDKIYDMPTPYNTYYWTSTTNLGLSATTTYDTAWYVAFGQAEDGNGEDLHGTGAVRFDAKILGSGEGEERVLNYVRLVRDR